MSDRELLELAAKAARYTWVRGITKDGGWWHENPDLARLWNPITDVGDRYRLARACKLIIDFDGGAVRWQFDGEEYKRSLNFTPGNETEEAYAVVTAAAEIGRNMK